MWPFRKRKLKISDLNYDEKIADVYQHLAGLNATLAALIAENRIDRDIPDKIQVISGQYRKMLRQMQEFETNLQPVFALIRNVRTFLHPERITNDKTTESSPETSTAQSTPEGTN
jgi:hypothetical protein